MLAEESCEAKCGAPMDVVLIHEGWTMHPSCAFPHLAVTEQDRLDALRSAGRRRRRLADEAAGSKRRPRGKR